MGGQFLPPDALHIEPIWRNFFENPGLVQFIHRMVGYLLLAFSVVVFLRGRKSANGRTRAAFTAAFAALCVQIVLGIFTVIYVAPWQIAIVHQVMAVAVFTLILRARFNAAYPLQQSIRGA